MFTGIVTEIGQILDCQDQASVRSLTLERSAGSAVPVLGASIACSGICLTVCEAGTDQKTQKPWFRVEASIETRKRTTLERWQIGDRLNLEPALKVGDELGGHLVFGHVDAVGSVHNITRNPDNEGAVISFFAPDTLSGLLAVKGSITIDGVSLTVNEVEKTNLCRNSFFSDSCSLYAGPYNSGKPGRQGPGQSGSRYDCPLCCRQIRPRLNHMFLYVR